MVFSLDRHLPLGIFATDDRCSLAAGTHHATLFDLVDDVGCAVGVGIACVQEHDVVLLATVEHGLANRGHLRPGHDILSFAGDRAVLGHDIQTVEPVRVVARAPFRKTYAGQRESASLILVGECVFDLDAEHDLAPGVVRPQIGQVVIRVAVYAPDLSRIAGARSAQAAHFILGFQVGPREGIACA